MKSLFFFVVAYMTMYWAVAQELDESGPEVNGHRMSYWLRTWVEKTTNVNQRTEAQRAFKQAGTNVIPFLLSELTVGDVVYKSGSASLEEVKQALERTIAAEAALRYMGLSVTSAIPEPTNLMASTNHGAVKAAAEILSDLGPAGVHALVSGLTNANSEARKVIPGVLSHMAMKNSGTNLLAELPALFHSLDTLPISAAFDCSYAISQSVVAEFVRRLESTNTNMRYIAAKTLGEMGTSAQLAIPDLEKLRSDPDNDVRNAADRALSRIRGDN
jgi:HEAT repeat protein